MKVKLPTIAGGVALFGATAMAADVSLYVAGGSHGDAPDQAKVTVTAPTTSVSYSLVLNLNLSQYEVLEPDRVNGEQSQPMWVALSHHSHTKRKFKLG